MIYKRTGHWHLDVTIHGVRYREALNTTDKRQAKELEKNRIAEIKQGKNASKTGREFARKPFHEAVKVYLEEREPHVSERTMQFETERPGPFVKHFGEKPILRFWPTAWRKLVGETAKRVAREAAQEALKHQQSIRTAIAAWKRAAAPVRGLRFHDLRHQAITEMAEAGASDATLMAVAGHMSRRMLEHYSHVRMAAKRTALEKLESGLMGGPSATSQPESRKAN